MAVTLISWTRMGAGTSARICTRMCTLSTRTSAHGMSRTLLSLQPCSRRYVQSLSIHGHHTVFAVVKMMGLSNALTWSLWGPSVGVERIGNILW